MAKDTTGRLHVTVKTGGKRKLSSKLWLERQLNDPYVAQAKRDGFRSRAAYKLIEIDDKYHFLKSGITVVDLGAAPGGWSQVAAKRVGAANGKGKVVAIDLLRYDRRRIDGVWMENADITATIARLLGMTYQERADNHCISPERADLVLAGCAILDAIRNAFPLPRLRVADRGLREGMLVEMMREDGALGGCR